VHLEPAALDREFEAGAVLGWRALVLEQERLVDFFDVDAPLNRLDRIGDFEDPPRGFFRVGVGAGGRVFHRGPILAGAGGLSSLLHTSNKFRLSMLSVCQTGHGMCEKCRGLEKKIERYRRVANSISDQLTIDRLNELIKDMEDEKAKIHFGQKK
jgi:hypothetical protein